MSKELLAALGRIEAIAHYYSKVAGHSDEITDAFKSIADEASETIALTKNADAPDLRGALRDLLDDALKLGLDDSEYSGSVIEARRTLAR